MKNLTLYICKIKDKVDKVDKEVTMTIALRKLALLEKNLEQREEQARLDGYASSPIDYALKEKITKLMEQARLI